MLGGYMGKMLFVDLTTGVIKEQELPEEMARDFIGGPSLGARILYNVMKPGVDPLGPDNVVGFVTGPTTGTGAFFGSRFSVVCKSPVTGGFNDASSGGFFGEELKRAGYDAVFVTGAAKEPVYIWINDGRAEIRSAAKLWGKDCKETLDVLVEETGEPKMRASVIGPPGEALSLISCPVNDGHRAPGRGGSGAVMGSKKLKGIAVRGTAKVPVADRAKVNEINRAISAAIKNSPMQQFTATWSDYGTGSLNTFSVMMGDAPTKNWGGSGVVDFGQAKATAVGSPTFDAKFKTKKYACSHCPLGCGAEYKVEGGRWPLPETERPELQTATVFGSLCLNDNVEAILKCNELCNRAGVDTIEAGSVVAWAIECYENGVLTKNDLDGIEATWGNAEAIVALTEKIAYMRGCGKVLALGGTGAAKKWGKGAQYVQAVAGIALPMHDPKCMPGYARTYATDPTPGRHCKGGIAAGQGGGKIPKYVYTGTGQLDLMMTCSRELLNASGLCLFLSMSGAAPETQTDIMSAVTGWTFTSQDQQSCGIRSMDIRQAFNVREGLTPADNVLPPRSIGHPPLQEGPTAGVVVDWEQLAQNFYDAIGWDATSGKPTLGSLEELGLRDVASDMYGETAV